VTNNSNPIKGARFIHPNVDLPEEVIRRDPSVYEPSRKFTQRFKELGGAVEGSYISDAIKYGEMYASDRDTITFVKDAGGVAYYIVTALEVKINGVVGTWFNYLNHQDIPEDAITHRKETAVTLWAYVYNEDEARATGRWSSRELERIKGIEPDLEYVLDDE
jgi:hypothetical protein